MSITPTGQNPLLFAIAVGGVYQGVANTAQITTLKDVTGSGDIGSGEMRLQNSAAFNPASVAGTYTYGTTGQSPSGQRVGELGFITIGNNNGTLSITSGSAVLNNAGTSTAITSITGSLTTVDANGRTVESANAAPFGATQYALYVVNSDELFAMSLDGRSLFPLLVGTGIRQSTNPFANSSIAGPDVITLQGNSGQSEDALIGLLVGPDGKSATLTSDSNIGGTVQTNQTQTGTFSVASNGVATLNFTNPVTVYLAQPDRGFAMTSDSSVLFGEINPQAPVSPTTPLGGNMVFGLREAIQLANSYSSGAATLGSAPNTLDVTDDESHKGGDIFFDQSLGTLNFTVGTNGHFTISPTAITNGESGYAISPFEFVILDQSGPTSNPTPTTHPKVIVLQSQIAGPGTPSPAAPAVTVPGTVIIGQTAQSPAITITNVGFGPLGFTGVNTANSPDFIVDPSSTCVGPVTVVVQPQGTCMLVLDFAPTANTVTGKLVTENLVVLTDGTSNVTVAASGTAQGVPDFTISATPATQTVAVGSGTTYTVNVTDLNGYSIPVLLTVSGFPSGSTLTFNPTSITGGTPSTLTVTTASDTPLGTSTLTITGTSGSLSHKTTTQLVVTPALVSIAVAPTAASIAAGNTQRFTATGTYSDESTQDITATVTWASSNTAAATIVSGGATAGTATGVKAGTTTITASLSGITSNGATLTVTAPLLVSIAVTPNPANVALNNTLQFTATGTFTDKSTQDLTTAVNWTSSDTTIATIGSATGLATGVSAGGPITITAAQVEGKISGTTQLTVTSITLQMAPGSPAAPPPVSPGGTVVIGIVLGVPPGTKGTATLTCAGTSPPDAAQFFNCTPVPGTVTFTGNGPTQVAVVLKTFCTDVPPAFPKIPGGLDGPLGMVLVILAVGGICFTLRRRPRWAVSFALVVIMVIGASSCGSPPAGPSGRTPAGNYTVTLTVTINGQSASLPIPITVVN
ncbi:MAG: Ig-like domain-containing protein, partial [Candidatus Acidiferrales bacterium]